MADKDGSKTHPKKQEIVRLERTDRPAPEISLHGLPEFLPGWVWLTGAGPGDPGLLTLHAVNALQQADCVVYDALVSEDILSLTRTEAELIYSGKRGGKPSLVGSVAVRGGEIACVPSSSSSASVSASSFRFGAAGGAAPRASGALVAIGR